MSRFTRACYILEAVLGGAGVVIFLAINLIVVYLYKRPASATGSEGFVIKYGFAALVLLSPSFVALAAGVLSLKRNAWGKRLNLFLVVLLAAIIGTGLLKTASALAAISPGERCERSYVFCVKSAENERDRRCPKSSDKKSCDDQFEVSAAECETSRQWCLAESARLDPWLACQDDNECTVVMLGCHYWQPVNALHARDIAQLQLSPCGFSVRPGPAPALACRENKCDFSEDAGLGYDN